MPDASSLLSLLYAGTGSAVCRLPCGTLVVRTADRIEGEVVLTQEQVLEDEDGLEALITLAA